MRKALVVGNWKMNGVRSDAVDLVAAIQADFESNGADIAVCVPSVYMSEVGQLLAGSSISLGAQNVAEHDSGAYTGEISAKMLNDFDCSFAIVGHSERRSYYNDSNESVARRYSQSLSEGITPILCVGETLEQRERNETFSWDARNIAAGTYGIVAEVNTHTATNNSCPSTGNDWDKDLTNNIKTYIPP